LFRGVVIFVPVGMLAATWFTAAERPVRRIGTSVLLGGLVVLGIEAAQLIVYSRPVATGDVITGMLGVLVGACLMRRWGGRDQDARPQAASDRAAWRAWLWLGLAGVYSLLLAVVLCSPFELIDDPSEIRARAEGFFAVPFAEAYRGSQVNVIGGVLRKVLFFAPLGALLSLTVLSPSIPSRVRRTLLAVLLGIAAGVGVLVELAQVYVSPHRPDVTDVILYTAGAALGMLVTVRMAGPRRATGSFTRGT
jgi:glycopeptide antibiotics resistance protein